MNVQESISAICERLPMSPGLIVSVLKNVAQRGELSIREAHQLISFGVSFHDSKAINIKALMRGESRPSYQDLEKHLIALAEEWRDRN